MLACFCGLFVLLRCGPILMLRQVVYHSSRGLGDARPMLVVERATGTVAFGEHQRGNRNLVVEGHQRLLFERGFRPLRRLVGIPGEQPLIESLRRAQGRLAAEQDVQEGELRQVPAEHDQADGEGVESSRPTGPHSQVQKIAAMMTAGGDSPVPDP